LDFSPWEFKEILLTSDLVVNTTPKFALDEFATGLVTQPSGIFFDALYDPWPTHFADAWSERGGRVMGGLELLIAQGIEQIKFFTGANISTSELSQFLRSEFSV
jgi:shikimate dehydrogenase